MFNGKFGDTPNTYIKYADLSEEAAKGILKDAQSQVSGRSLREIEQMRDEFLVGVLKLRADIEAKYGFNQSRFL